MTKPTHTPEDLEREADTTLRLSSTVYPNAYVIKHDENVQALLRAGAAAMRVLKIAIAAGVEVEQELSDANARIKELEANQRTPGTVEVCNRYMHHSCEYNPGRADGCEYKDCPLKPKGDA